MWKKKLSWPHHVCKREIWVLKLVLPRHFSLKLMYQDRRVNGQVLFCMSVRINVTVECLIGLYLRNILIISWRSEKIRDFEISHLLNELNAIHEYFRGEIWFLCLDLPRHFLLKFMYQDRKVSGHVLFCMSVRREIWVLSLV
jgi:hypothetical protein